MKTKITFCAMVILLSAFSGSVFGGTEGTYNTFYGSSAGASNTGDTNADTFIGAYAGQSNTTGSENTFIGIYNGRSNTTGISNTFLGRSTGYNNTTGSVNTFIGMDAGYYNTTGFFNTFLGFQAGLNNTTGSRNVFLGNSAGHDETGSNKLYIHNSSTSTPLIYGEFDNNILTINGNLSVVGPNNGLIHLTNVTTNSTSKVARIVLNHYNNSEEPVYLFGAASTLTDNFVALGGGNTIGHAATRIDLFTAPNTTTPVGSPRLTIIGNGYVGIGIQDPLYPLEMASGAYVTPGGVWTNASSREYKDNIEALSTGEALDTLQELNPVKFAYKRDRAEKHVGFIAEEVPDLIATEDRKGLSPMDIVAVLTKVVQEQQKTISTMREELNELKGKVR